MASLPDQPHEELAAYLLGRLDDEEAHAFRRHLAGCARCRAEETELREVATLLQGTAPSQPSADLEARTLAAVAAAAAETDATEASATIPASASAGSAPPATMPASPHGGPPAPAPPAPPTDELAARRERRRGPRAAALVAAVAAGLAVAFVLGAGTAEQTTRTVAEPPRTVTVPDTELAGTEEKSATLEGDGFQASAQVNAIGPGRLVEVKSETVPIIPKGTYYELWFVGPGDAPNRPNRISAGTWHPDKKGITDVRFLIAADPEKFPDIEVTKEPPDGDPRPSGNVVLAST